MTARERRRLTLISVVAVLLPAVWYTARLLAQTPERPLQVWHTPAEVSQAFLSYIYAPINSRKLDFRATEDDKEDQALRNIISRKSYAELQENGVHFLLTQFRNHQSIPRWEAETDSETDDTRATNTGNATMRMRAVFNKPVVCVQEGQIWRVDLVATVALWNQLPDNTVQELIDRTRENASRAQCQSNLKQITLSMLQYTQDWDERYPPANKWCDALQPYTKSEPILNCPSLKSSEKYGYAMNWKLSRRNPDELQSSSQMVLIYESSVLKRNHSGEGKDLAFRHFGGANYAYEDGHVKWNRQDRPQNFLLSPPPRNP